MYYALLLVFPTVTCCVCQHSIKALLTYLHTKHAYSFLSDLHSSSHLIHPVYSSSLLFKYADDIYLVVLAVNSDPIDLISQKLDSISECGGGGYTLLRVAWWPSG